MVVVVVAEAAWEEKVWMERKKGRKRLEGGEKERNAAGKGRN